MSKSGALAILLGKPKQDKETEDEMEGEDGSVDDGLKATARDLIDAVKADDEDAVATAIKSFFEQC